MCSKINGENWEEEPVSIEQLRKYWRLNLLTKRMYGGVYQAPVDENNHQEMSRMEEFLKNLDDKNKITKYKPKEKQSDLDKHIKELNNKSRKKFEIRSNEKNDKRIDRKNEKKNDRKNDDYNNRRPILDKLSSSTSKVDTFNRFTAISLIKSNNK